MSILDIETYLPACCSLMLCFQNPRRKSKSTVPERWLKIFKPIISFSCWFLPCWNMPWSLGFYCFYGWFLGRFLGLLVVLTLEDSKQTSLTGRVSFALNPHRNFSPWGIQSLTHKHHRLVEASRWKQLGCMKTASIPKPVRSNTGIRQLQLLEITRW